MQGTVDVGNLPATQAVTGTVDVGNLPATQQVAGRVSVDNLPATQTVDGVVGLDPAANTVRLAPGSIPAPESTTTKVLLDEKIALPPSSAFDNQFTTRTLDVSGVERLRLLIDQSEVGIEAQRQKIYWSLIVERPGSGLRFVLAEGDVDDPVDVVADLPGTTVDLVINSGSSNQTFTKVFAFGR